MLSANNCKFIFDLIIFQFMVLVKSLDHINLGFVLLVFYKCAWNSSKRKPDFNCCSKPKTTSFWLNIMCTFSWIQFDDPKVCFVEKNDPLFFGASSIDFYHELRANFGSQSPTVHQLMCQAWKTRENSKHLLLSTIACLSMVLWQQKRKK